jgi:hypothetical protein
MAGVVQHTNDRKMAIKIDDGYGSVLDPIRNKVFQRFTGKSRDQAFQETPV